MKPQDILFLIVLLILIWRKSPKYFTAGGLICLILAMPLYHLQIFFTAERFVWYAFAYLSIAIIIDYIINNKHA